MGGAWTYGDAGGWEKDSVGVLHVNCSEVMGLGVGGWVLYGSSGRGVGGGIAYGSVATGLGVPGGRVYRSDEGGRGDGGTREYRSLLGDGSGDVCGVGVDG